MLLGVLDFTILTSGLVSAVEAAVTSALPVLAVLIAIGANRWWRLPLFLMFWGAAGGFFQWRDKT